MYLLLFDLRHDYGAEAWHRLWDAVRGMFGGAAPLHSAWLIESESSSTEIVEALLGAGAIHEEDEIVVLELGGTASVRNVAAVESMRWMKAHFALS